MATNNTKIGDNNTLGFTLGDKPVLKMYLGDTLVYEVANVNINYNIYDPGPTEFETIDDLLN